MGKFQKYDVVMVCVAANGDFVDCKGEIEHTSFVGAASAMLELKGMSQLPLRGGYVSSEKNTRYFQGNLTPRSRVVFFGRRTRDKKVNCTLLHTLTFGDKAPRFVVLNDVAKSPNKVLISGCGEGDEMASCIAAVMKELPDKRSTSTTKLFEKFDPTITTHEVMIPVNLALGNPVSLDTTVERATNASGRWGFYPNIPAFSELTDNDMEAMISGDVASYSVHFFFEKESDALVFKLGSPQVIA